MISSEKENIEYSGDHYARLIVKGQWLYDNIAPMPVQIFALNYDYFFEMLKEEGHFENSQEPYLDYTEPLLNKQGEQYVIAWYSEKYFSFAASFSTGGLTLDEAKVCAEDIVKQKITWSELKTKDYV